jgi:hypothetical protein
VIIMNATLPRRLCAASILAALAAAVPAQAQLVYHGFSRIDQSDATFVSITSADMLGLEAVPVRSYSCTVAWGVRTSAESTRQSLAAGTLTGAAVGAGALSADVQRELLGLLYGRGGGAGIAHALAPAGSGRRAEGAAARLVQRLDGLLAVAERMDPARPGVAAPTRLAAALSAFDDYLDASSSAFLASPPDELLAVHAVLTRLVNGGITNHGRTETRAVPGSGLACAVAGVHEEVTPQGRDSSMEEEMRPFAMCMVLESGPAQVYGLITSSGDSLAIVEGEQRVLREAYPAVPTATETPWYHAGSNLTIGRDGYGKWSGTRELVPGSVALFGRYEGINVYAAPGVPRPNSVYVPVGGCGFQEYRLNRANANLRG